MTARKTVFILLSLLVCFVVVDYLVSRLPFAEPRLKGDIDKVQEKQIDIYVEMNKQLLTLASLVIAGAGLKLQGLTAVGRARRTLIVSMIMAALSIYAGYQSYDKLVWMLNSSFFNLNTPLLYVLRVLQFWSFVGSLFLFAWHWLTSANS